MDIGDSVGVLWTEAKNIQAISTSQLSDSCPSGGASEAAACRLHNWDILKVLSNAILQPTGGR